MTTERDKIKLMTCIQYIQQCYKKKRNKTTTKKLMCVNYATPFPGQLISRTAQISNLYLSISSTNSLIAPAPYNVPTFQTAFLISLILFHCLYQILTCANILYRGSRMNSTKLLCAEPCGDFFVNLRLKQL